MILFENFEKTQINFLNGKISQFMDAYVRKHKVWTPEQMQTDFIKHINSEVTNGTYIPNPKYAEFTTKEEIYILKIKLEVAKWLNTENGNEFSLKRFTKKYNNNKPIAKRESPIIERIRFGTKWNKDEFYDINFGLKDSFRYIKTSELEKIKYLPWTVEHVNIELKKNYNCNILDCLNKLSKSHLESKFVEYWKENYYSIESPAILPEVCGFRSNFYYFEYKDNLYSKKNEILEEVNDDVKIVNFRYDFLIINFRNQKKAFIELDGFENHKSRKQQTIDSIKRNNASSNGITLFNFTSKRINENIKSVFSELESFLK
jgi:very-short-patch-repair endonuclease